MEDYLGSNEATDLAVNYDVKQDVAKELYENIKSKVDALADQDTVKRDIYENALDTYTESDKTVEEAAFEAIRTFLNESDAF